MTTRRRADLALLAVAAVWGATFVMVREAVALVGPFTFLAIRFAIAGTLMALLFARPLARAGRRVWGAGALVGTLLFAGYAFQTAGLQHTTASRAGFLTGLAVVMIPFVSWLWLRRRPGRGPVAGALLATAGLALLAWQPGEAAGLNRGDLLVLACALCFALHIVALGRYAPEMPPRALATIQILAAAALSGLAMARFEPLGGPVPSPVWAAAAFTGLFATALAFLVQTQAQAHTTPAHVGVIFATEPVFAALAGVLLAGETMAPIAWAGCALILAGMLVAELAGDSTPPAPATAAAAGPG
jgi:drug/metabolite transporter (DMT)-like permease